ncbi:substrate-binding periplasmic protein [Aeromicrobium massiliense]|uniref:substrate-binding periplasmic protein n=1 Tax=Aeromicrobium massiliense TaxID=1464554 RepID=UPI0009D93D6D|nr:ABC transporter substrate-binding protein [Aeromicrobium massiliense]
MKSSVLRVGGVLAAAALVLSACGSDSESSVAADCKPAHDVSTVKEGVLTVGLTNTPPYSFEQDREIAGIDSDILKALAEEECLEIEHAPYTYAAAIPAVNTGRVDVAVGGFYRTEARAKETTLSAPLYVDELTVMSEDGYSTVDDLLGKKIGTVEGYLWVDALKALPGTDLRVYADSGALANDLKAGRLDAALDGYGAATISAKGTDFELAVLEEDDRVPATNEPSQTSMLVHPKDEALAKALDELVGAMREDGRLVKILGEHGLPETAAEVGEARLVS